MTEKYLFPSEEWAKKFMELINANEEYAKAAETWEGDFVFELTPDDRLKETKRIYVDLWHGKCRNAYLMASDEEKETEYVYSGPYENWLKLIEGKIDPIKGLMMRKFKLKGNMAKVLKAVKAASELVKTAASVPTEFT
ncbi:MAG: SCP2 sterol-binding domain-containing protein [Candidatus Hodarchaeota archaeon]